MDILSTTYLMQISKSELGAQLPAQQLAGGVAGQRRHELPLGRHLEARQRGAREGPQFLAGRRVGRVGRDHEGLDGLAEQPVRHADHRGLGYQGMLEQPVFDLHRVDVLAAPDDHVPAPADQVEVAVVVEPAQVTRAQPAVGAGREQVIGPGDHLAGPGAVRVADAHLGSWRRAAYRLEQSVPPGRGEPVILRRQPGDRAALGLPVEAEKVDAGELGHGRAQGVRMDGRGPVLHDPQGAQRQCALPEQHLHHGGYRERVGDAQLGKPPPRFHGETGHGHRGGARGQRDHDVAQPGDVVERRCGGEDAAGPQLLQAGVQPGTAGEPVVPAGHGLGVTGRP